jgi:tetratricopeptide (TPR) repeat protein
MFTDALTRACRQLSQISTQTSSTPARNVVASLSKRVAIPRYCFSLLKKRSTKLRVGQDLSIPFQRITKAGTLRDESDCCDLRSWLLDLVGIAGARADALEDCHGARDLDRRIRGCTSLIRSGRLSKTAVALAHGFRSEVYFKKDDTKAALADLNKCLEIDPKAQFCGRARATVRCYEARTGTSDALQIEAHCSHLKNSKDRSERADFYQALGTSQFSVFVRGGATDLALLDKAVDNLGKAIAIDSGSVQARADRYSLRGIAYLRKTLPGSPVSEAAKEALTDFNSAVALQPTKASNYLHRGYAHNQLLNVELAWADFKKAK